MALPEIRAGPIVLPPYQSGSAAAVGAALAEELKPRRNANALLRTLRFVANANAAQRVR